MQQQADNGTIARGGADIVTFSSTASIGINHWIVPFKRRRHKTHFLCCPHLRINKPKTRTNE
jgi:hypothetical protein